MMIELTQKYVKSLFDYRNGELYWKVRKAQFVKIGDRAGYVMKNGYRRVGINGKNYSTHRLIFLYHHGYLPKEIDHIDNDTSNNDISNLREATHKENCMNIKKPKSHNGKPTTSRFKDVHWDKHAKKWVSRVTTICGKRKFFGYHDSEIEAAEASDRALIERDSKFALTNAMLFPKIFKTKE